MRIAGRRIFCIQALQADPEISLEQLSDWKTNFTLRIHNKLRILADGQYVVRFDEVALLGVVGRDISGSLLREALQTHGIDDRWLVEDERASTLHKWRFSEKYSLLSQINSL